MVLKFMPSSTPAGTFIVTVRVTRVKPLPEHFVQRSLIVLPLPPQVWQVRIVCTWPNGEFIVTRCWPLPPQVGQVCGWVPGFAPEP